MEYEIKHYYRVKIRPWRADEIAATSFGVIGVRECESVLDWDKCVEVKKLLITSINTARSKLNK